MKTLKKSKYSKMIEELSLAIQPIPKKTRGIRKQYWMINFIFIVLVNVKQKKIQICYSRTFTWIGQKN